MSNDLHLRNLAVPFLSQRKNEYVWKQRYTKDDFVDENNPLIGEIKPDGDKYSMACRSCNITSIAMVLRYFGITKESPDSMMRRYFDRTDANDKAALGNLSTAVNALEFWKNLEAFINALYTEKVKDLFEKSITDDFVRYYNADKNESDYGRLSITHIKQAIAEGYPVIANHGGLKESGTSGHIVVIRGFTMIRGSEYIILNDPYGDPAKRDGSLLSEGIRGVYYERSGSVGTQYTGSSGDNCMIQVSEYQKIIEGTAVTSAIIIRLPLWNYPDGSTVREGNAIYTTEIYKGGGFPLKMSSLWHNGIHMDIAREVYSIGAGRLIAARNEMNPPVIGDTSFLLVRHECKQPSTECVEHFYTLYMHTKPCDLHQYAQDFFMHGTTNQQIQWPLQLYNQLVPFQYIVFAGGNTTDNSGLINNAFENIILYNARCEDGIFYKENKSDTKLGQRMLIHPLPANNQSVFKRLLDPSRYNDKSFIEAMTDKKNFEKKYTTRAMYFSSIKNTYIAYP